MSDMDYIYTVDNEEILIEPIQRSTRNNIIRQYVSCRKKKKMTQEDLFKRTGISRPNIARFESGKYNPSLEMMVRIAAGLDMQLDINLQAMQE
ncbi:MAG: helix-turn-helix transcriptional regulator [Lachnospiraceae bacterium]|nr:helix-turn-helix transcriptional regulator [Lachnospiraceae bacterium]